MRTLGDHAAWFTLSGPRWLTSEYASSAPSPISDHKRGPRDPQLRHGRVLSFTSLAILGGFYK